MPVWRRWIARYLIRSLFGRMLFKIGVTRVLPRAPAKTRGTRPRLREL